MKNNASLVYRVCLVIADALALIGAFVLAYILRVSISHRPLSEYVPAMTYVEMLLAIIPFFIVIFALLGLYNARIYERRFNEFGKLLVGTFIGILFAISASYIMNVTIFPARLVVLYAFIFAFGLVLLLRTVLRGVRRQLFSYGVGINHVLLVGDTPAAKHLIHSLAHAEVTGYKVYGVVGKKQGNDVPGVRYAHYRTFAEAVNKVGPELHTIIQTELYADPARNNEILTYAQENHVVYRFVPGNDELFTGNIEAEVFYGAAVITVHQTPLVGWGQVVKRLFDIVVSFIAIIVSLPLMLVVAALVKLSDGGPVFFAHERVSRFDRKVKVLKFRSNNMRYNGLEPEEAFTKMGRPELIEEYRANGDRLERDPRITAVGRFIRATSIDELPQLFNVLRGDLSLVGPRALVAYELNKYTKKNRLLSVKSGLTGLAVVSGRRDISFEERRQLDLYYVQNWSFWGDIVIIVKTVWIVLRRKGAN